MSTNNNQDTASYESILKQAGGRNVAFKFSKTYPAYLTLLIALAISALVWYYVDQTVKTNRESEFEKAVESVMTRFESQYRTNFQVLTQMRGIYDDPNIYQVVRDYFNLYASVSTKTYPAINSLIYAPNIPADRLGEHVHYTQSQGLYDYRVFPIKEGKQLYYPISYIVPQEINFHLSGYDLHENKVVTDAIEKSRNEGIYVATPFIELPLRKGKNDTTGFFVVSAIFDKEKPRKTLVQRRENFQGAVLIEILGKEFFIQALGDAAPTDKNIVFECFDSQNGTEKLVFRSSNYDDHPSDYEPYLRDERILNIADRQIMVKFATIPKFGGEFQAILPILALIASIALSLLFFGFLLSVMTSRARAVDLAERMTRSQRRIVETSNDIIAATDLDGVWKSMNPASQNILNYTPENLIGEKIDILFVKDEDKKAFYDLIAKTDKEHTERLDVEMRAAGGDLKWISWSFSISKQDGFVYSIGRDITLEKIAEQEALLRSKQVRLAEQYAREGSEFKSFFMTKLSHQLRNSLTGIIGYLQLLQAKVYDDEEELDNYVDMAADSSEELFTFVSDIVEVAGGTDENKEIGIVRFGGALEDATRKVKSDGYDTEISLMDPAGADAVALADRKHLTETLARLFKAISTGSHSTKIEIAATENRYEGATEIQIMTSPNALVAEMIEIYKYNKSSLIDALKADKEDIVLQLAIAGSNFRMMNGSMSVETLGAEEGNVVQITLPINKRTEE